MISHQTSVKIRLPVYRYHTKESDSISLFLYYALDGALGWWCYAYFIQPSHHNNTALAVSLINVKESEEVDDKKEIKEEEEEDDVGREEERMATRKMRRLEKHLFQISEAKELFKDKNLVASLLRTMT